MFDDLLGHKNLSAETQAAIEKTIKSHSVRAKTRRGFRPDPLLGTRSLQHSLESSAVKRHGLIIEMAIGDALRDSGHYQVWRKVHFLVPRQADSLTDGRATEECLQVRIPYGAEPNRTTIVDIIAYDENTGRLGAYEVKRGLYTHDADKSKSIRRNVLGVNVSLASWTQKLHPYLKVQECISRALFYYGARSIERELSLAEKFDQHFGCQIMPFVDAATAYMQALLYDANDDMIALEEQKTKPVFGGDINA